MCQFRISAVSAASDTHVVTYILNKIIHTCPTNWMDSADTEMARHW
jgi:hypothetical protein